MKELQVLEADHQISVSSKKKKLSKAVWAPFFRTPTVWQSRTPCGWWFSLTRGELPRQAAAIQLEAGGTASSSLPASMTSRDMTEGTAHCSSRPSAPWWANLATPDKSAASRASLGETPLLLSTHTHTEPFGQLWFMLSPGWRLASRGRIRIEQPLLPHSLQPPPQQRRQQLLCGKHPIWRKREEQLWKKNWLCNIFERKKKKAGPTDFSRPLQRLRLAESERRVTTLRPTHFTDLSQGFFFLITTGLFQERLPLKPSSTAVSMLAVLLGEGSRALTSLPVRAPHKHSIVCENVQCARGTLHIWQLLLATSLGLVSTPAGEDCMRWGGCAP